MTHEKTIIVATHRLTKERVAEVAVACDRVGATVVFSNDRLECADSQEGVIVGGLRSGERRIPDEILRCLTSNTSLLLLCEEALVRPSVTLYSGRVALMGAASPKEAIASKLRVLLSRPMAETGEVDAEECAHTNWWSRGTRVRATESLLYVQGNGGFTLVFNLKAAHDFHQSALDWVNGQTERTNRGIEERHELAQSLGDDMGVIQYVPRQREWFVGWPSSTRTLWLLSPARLPVLSDLSSSAGNKSNIQASHGDVMIALSRTCSEVAADELVRNLPSRAEWGGPSAFDFVSKFTTTRPDAWARVTELQ